MNLTSIAIDQATLRIYFENASPAPQYGFFNSVLPGQNFATTKTYTFTVESSARPTVLEYDDNHFFADTPVAGALKWEFSGNSLIWIDPNADITAPSVTTFSPVDEATNVAVDSNIAITFNEAIQRGTGNIVLKITDGATVATYDMANSSNLSISGSTLTINPTTDLASSTGYKVEFAAGTIKDLAGNSYAGTSSYNFTTISAATAGNDTLVGGSGDLDGGAGIDTVTYSTARASHTVIKTSPGYVVSGFELTNIERLQFSDVNLALDLDGNAGLTVKILGAVFGASSITIKEHVGVGLSLLDGGMSYPDLMLLALNARLGDGFSNADEVSLLYQNLVGVPPSTADLNYYVETITSGQFTQTSLAVMAADLDLNATNIDLVGLAQTGIEYSL